LKCQLDATR